MFGDRSRLVRLLLLAATVLAVVAWPTRHYSAFAATSGDDDDDASGGGGDDDGKGGDATAGDDDDDAADADQPPVTAGGLYTKDNYPISALDRPLTLIEGLAEIHAGLNTDLASGDEFGKFGADLLGHYGVRDNLEVQARANLDYNKFTSVAVGLEGGLNYDPYAIDIRGSAYVRNAGGNAQLGVGLGLPIRLKLAPQIAITALESLFNINVTQTTGDVVELAPSVGVIAVPIPAVAILAHVQLIDANFKFNKASVSAAATLAAQVTPMNKVDIGLEFLLPALNTVSPGVDATGMALPAPKPYDARELELYVNLRF